MNLFGTDGIRGIANSDLSPDIAFRLGRAIGLHLSFGQPLCVGKDTRKSGDMLEASLIAGVTSTGRDILRVGVITTSGLSFLVKDLGLGGGIMISASHNPAVYNGLKVLGPDGTKVPEETEVLLSTVIRGDAADGPYPTGDAIGTVVPSEVLVDRYVRFLSGIPANRFPGLKVVVDAANGSASSIAGRVWESLGATVDLINASPNGLNINERCGSTYPCAMAERVEAIGAAAGFAYDGDGDRCIGVDEKGQVVDGDGLMAILALDMARKGTLAGNAVVGTVMSNYGFELCLQEHGISLLRTSVGDRYVLEKMRETGHNLGGEQSGHIILRDILETGDGMVTSLLVADVLVSSKVALSSLRNVIRSIPQVLVNVAAEDPKRIAYSDKVTEAVSQVQAELQGRGRVLVRPSGTEPVVRIMVEAVCQEEVDSSIQYLKRVIEKERTSLEGRQVRS